MGEVGRTKDHRLSLPASERIRLPSARGETGPPALPQEVVGDRPGLQRQSAVDKPLPESAKVKPSAKRFSSSPYAVSSVYTVSLTSFYPAKFFV